MTDRQLRNTPITATVRMVENFRSGLIWRVMRRSPYLRRGLERAGFQGGWLDRKG